MSSNGGTKGQSSSICYFPSVLELSSADWSRTCSSPVLPAGLWGRGCCADSQVCSPGALPHPPPGTQLSGSCLSCEDPVTWWPLSPRHRVTPGGTTPGGGQPSSPGVSPARTTQLPVRRGLDARGAGGADLHSWGAPRGRSVLAVLCPPGLCQPRGRAGSWAPGPRSPSGSRRPAAPAHQVRCSPAGSWARGVWHALPHGHLLCP